MKKMTMTIMIALSLCLLVACEKGYEYSYDYNYEYVYGGLPDEDGSLNIGMDIEEITAKVPMLSDEEIGNIIIKARTEFFASYEPFGLKYDADTDRLYFDGKLVRYFEDVDRHTYWPNIDGEIDVFAVRNDEGTLIEIIPFTQEEFTNRIVGE